MSGTVDMGEMISQATLAQIGGGTLAGIAVGYAAKRTAKLALFFVGLILIGLFAMQQQGWITVHWKEVGEGLEAGSRGAGNYLAQMVKQLGPSLVGFGAGFLMGLKIR